MYAWGVVVRIQIEALLSKQQLFVEKEMKSSDTVRTYGSELDSWRLSLWHSLEKLTGFVGAGFVAILADAATIE